MKKQGIKEMILLSEAYEVFPLVLSLLLLPLILVVSALVVHIKVLPAGHAFVVVGCIRAEGVQAREAVLHFLGACQRDK